MFSKNHNEPPKLTQLAKKSHNLVTLNVDKVSPTGQNLGLVFNCKKQVCSCPVLIYTMKQNCPT
jgi:hypothetical protein